MIPKTFPKLCYVPPSCIYRCWNFLCLRWRVVIDRYDCIVRRWKARTGFTFTVPLRRGCLVLKHSFFCASPAPRVTKQARRKTDQTRAQVAGGRVSGHAKPPALYVRDARVHPEPTEVTESPTFQEERHYPIRPSSIFRLLWMSLGATSNDQGEKSNRRRLETVRCHRQ